MKLPKTLIIVNLIKSMGLKLLLIMAIMSLVSNCSKVKIWKDDELSIKRIPYTEYQLKLKGYYYQKYGNPEKLTIYFFYNDGTLLLAGDSYDINETIEFEQSFITKEFIEKRRNIKYCWGVFNINGNNMKFERWYPSQRPYKAYVRAGTILNDTTFHITESYRMQDGKKTEVDVEDEIYHFKQLNPKPDSTNSFVE
ncbi:MAG: hypothetical protein K8R41_00420 [Bacteroidales bacterium]|nr:hypothetical protein [Bacteroidales bacterium]